MTHQIVSLAPEHLNDVYRIECGAHPHPWSEKMIRDINSRGGCHHVMMVNSQLVGYFYAQNIVGEVTLLNIAVATEHQGKGYGKILLEAFLTMCEQANAESAWLEVRESNIRAFGLYEHTGFNEVDRRRNYYPVISDSGKASKEDAIIMSYIFF